MDILIPRLRVSDKVRGFSWGDSKPFYLLLWTGAIFTCICSPWQQAKCRSMIYSTMYPQNTAKILIHYESLILFYIPGINARKHKNLHQNWPSPNQASWNQKIFRHSSKFSSESYWRSAPSRFFSNTSFSSERIQTLGFRHKPAVDAKAHLCGHVGHVGRRQCKCASSGGIVPIFNWTGIISPWKTCTTSFLFLASYGCSHKLCRTIFGICSPDCFCDEWSSA